MFGKSNTYNSKSNWTVRGFISSDFAIYGNLYGDKPEQPIHTIKELLKVSKKHRIKIAA